MEEAPWAAEEYRTEEGEKEEPDMPGSLVAKFASGVKMVGGLE
jgi:hypothetical protein